MLLNKYGVEITKKEWEAAGYHLPHYNRTVMQKATRENPFWIHFGAGNIFRAFQAGLVQNLLNDGVLEKGVIAVGGHETMEQLSHPHDDYSLLVTLKADGTVEKTVIGSVAEFLTMDSGYESEFQRLKEIMRADSLQIVSFTITEKGYNLSENDGALLPEVTNDLRTGPENSSSYMGKIAALLYTRYLAGENPVAMVSMDNCSHNGSKLQDALLVFAKGWAENGQVSQGFVDYLENPMKVSFPWSMIDKITPRPSASVEEILSRDNIQDLKPIITERGTYIAPFVNAEECEYLVIEDSFPNGRPPLEKGGIIFTDRETVDKAEKMKVCTCLNPLHTALAVFGCLLGYKLISKEMTDVSLRKLAEGIGYSEGLPVVVNPGILDPKEFIDTVLNLRFPNPFMPDTPQRIATDTSQKLPVRFGETLKAYAKSDCLKLTDLKLIPLVFAGWIRYLMGIDDSGQPFELSADPLLDTVCPYVSEIRLGEAFDAEKVLHPILEDAAIFGVSLYEVHLDELVCRYFSEMTASAGAVRAVLEKYVASF